MQKDLFIAGATVYDRQSPYHQQQVDIYVNEGKILYIGTPSSSKSKSFYQKATHKIAGHLGVSVGWIDLRAHFCDPGEEAKEDIFTGLSTAAAGGYVGVCVLPNTHPAIEEPSVVKYMQEKAKDALTELYVMGNIFTHDNHLADMLRLHSAGVNVFTNLSANHNTNELLQALTYLKPLNALMIDVPMDNSFGTRSLVHEGIASTALGLHGIPDMAEKIMVYRDIELLQYTQSRLHLSCLSSKNSLPLIAEAKKRKLALSCDVGVQHLVYNDTMLNSFNTQHKVFPPYRTEEDRLALIKGVKDEVIDAIVSVHTPQAIEDKEMEFDKAAAGTISLGIVFPLLNSLQHELPLHKALPLLCEKPYHILQKPLPTLTEGATACLTVFDTQATWTFDAATNNSKSINSPFYGQQMKGRVIATIHGKKSFILS